ncbi:rhodanese-like domain-containing protein [Micromonospora aurantiaca]|uniref:Rhodanese-like domain-containing protein n=1 Tax=Micromonospora aurantiaca (nom. illeg.) TaxID=47850 RepID=A0ABQ6ULF6_9ACTN|nr:rhodanese-like domain-containing protein [Micromonospora aurantiaca]KAB1117943.1 rhodanese-like domain-containing protein [Micromonospora aurantiaca]UFN92608.1 rhodanese-like domain-containing protein [Micromonospora aurantiaca]SCL43083.1 Rhodanese-related sulfurtransferase [Micromonospora aurantiaca]
MREVDMATFSAAHADGATVIDVREPVEYVGGHVPGARCIPLGHLPTSIRDLPRRGTVYVICASGNRSQVGAELLERAGIDARSVAGGTAAWARAGRSLTQGSRA